MKRYCHSPICLSDVGRNNFTTLVLFVTNFIFLLQVLVYTTDMNLIKIHCVVLEINHSNL